MRKCAVCSVSERGLSWILEDEVGVSQMIVKAGAGGGERGMAGLWRGHRRQKHRLLQRCEGRTWCAGEALPAGYHWCLISEGFREGEEP